MNVLYTCDNNYVWLMGISTISLFENNKELEDLKVYLLGENISDENKSILLEIGREYNRSIIVIDVPKIDIPEALVSARWPLSAFTRLYSGQLLPPSVDKVLYLDCDTIVCGNISGLDAVDLTGKVFFGIKDCVGQLYKENIGLEGNDAYINAGVLLINLTRLRTIDLEKTLNSYMDQYEKLINYADQDVLNGAFHDEIGILSPDYDVMTIVAVYSYDEIQKLRKPTNYYKKEELKQAVQSPIIIHYTTNMRTVRPWFTNTNHPLASVFRKYMEISPWKDKTLSEIIFNTREAKIISIVEKLPRKLSLNLLGLLHSQIKPLAVRLKTKRG